MTPKDSFLSPNAMFLLFYDIDAVLCSSQCYNNLDLFPPCKPPDPAKDICEGQTYDLKKRVEMWMRMNVVPVGYGTFAQKFHLTMWFFQFITRITFKCDYVMRHSVALLIWIGLCNKLIIYRVTTDPVIYLADIFDFYGEHSC